MSRGNGGARSNEEWILALRSSNWQESELAHRDLAAYLYRVAVNRLLRRQAQANPSILARFSLEELETLAQDFVQDTLEKMVRDNYALLDKFADRGPFTSWMAVITCNLIADELRRASWKRQVSPGRADDEQSSSFFEQQAVYPEQLEERELSEAMQSCLDKLNSNRRTAIWSRVVEERPIEEIKNEMNKTEAAVYSLLSRARRDLQKCLGG